MYPSSRPAARASSSAAASPQTNPLRSNNNRIDSYNRRPSGAGTDAPVSTQRAIGDSESDFSGSQSMDDKSAEQARDTQRLNQIVQQFFVKGALIVAASRVYLPPFINRAGTPRVNKWFNILVNDSEELSRQTTKWRVLDIEVGLPKTMTIEIYLDLRDITRGKSLVLVDDHKRYDVADTIIGTQQSQSRKAGTESKPIDSRILLERWQFSMEDISNGNATPDADVLSNVYKKGIPIFRSLYSQTRLLPAYKYHRRNLHGPSGSGGASIALKYRIIEGAVRSSPQDPLEIPLYPNQRNIVDRYSFGPLQCPAGLLHASVVYRTNSDFRVDDSEALLSSHFMRSGDEYFRPSWPGRAVSESNQVAGSAPQTKKGIAAVDEEGGQVYGSLSTFHGTGIKASSSPISALRAVTDAGSPGTPGMRPPPRPVSGSKSSLRTGEGQPGNPRRPSISFQPFKAGSLSSSPATGMQVPLSPASASARPVPTLSHRSRPSLTTLPQAILRQPNLQSENAVASSTSSSPKPAPPITKFSSSFNYRKSRMSTGASRGDEERSSGRPSPSSSARIGSDVLNDRGDQASSGSVQQTDDEHLQDFLKLLEQKRDLPSLSRSDAAAKDASMKRTTAALSKYQQMKESNSALSDSMSSSFQPERTSPSGSSRQLSHMPGTSYSPASSLGKPMSPHTPHTPAVPSRLSSNSVANYSSSTPRRSRSNARHRMSSTDDNKDGSAGNSRRTDAGTTAIPIPTSPRLWSFDRRSSSAAGPRSTDNEDQQRAYSMPDDRETSVEMASDESRRLVLPEAAEPMDADPRSSDEPSPAEYPSQTTQHRYSSTADPTSQGLFSRRPRGLSSRRQTPAFVSSYSPSSSGQAGSGVASDRSSTAERGGARPAPSLRNSAQEDDALIFELSDMDSRRSLEDAPERGGNRGGRGWR